MLSGFYLYFTPLIILFCLYLLLLLLFFLIKTFLLMLLTCFKLMPLVVKSPPFVFNLHKCILFWDAFLPVLSKWKIMHPIFIFFLHFAQHPGFFKMMIVTDLFFFFLFLPFLEDAVYQRNILNHWWNAFYNENNEFPSPPRPRTGYLFS